MTAKTPPRVDAPEAPPPLLGSWRNLYVLVLTNLAALVVLLYALSRWAS